MQCALCSNICLSTFHIFREFHSYEHHTHHTNSQRVIAQSNCFGYCAIVRFFCHSDNICWRLLCGTSRQKTFETATFHRIFHSQQFIWNVYMDITALPVHFAKFMCTSFPACGRTKWRADEKDTEMRAREREGG